MNGFQSSVLSLSCERSFFHFLFCPPFSACSATSANSVLSGFSRAFILKLRADYRRIEESHENGFSELKFISCEQRFPRPREASLPARCSSSPPQDSSQHGAPRLRA